MIFWSRFDATKPVVPEPPPKELVLPDDQALASFQPSSGPPSADVKRGGDFLSAEEPLG